MKRRFALLLAVITIQQSVVFAQTNPLIKYLPDNASMVMNFNAIKLAGNIPGESFRQSSVYREIMKDTKMPFNALLMNPEKSGIDFTAGVFLVMTNDATEEKPGPGATIFIKLRDAELFTANIKDLFKENSDSIIKKYGTDRIMQHEKGLTLGWNNDLLVIIPGYSKKEKEEQQQVYLTDSTSDIKDYDKLMNITIDKIQRSQRNLCFDLLTPKPQNVLSTNSHFISLMNTVADIKTWNNGMPNPLLGNKLSSILGTGLNKLQGFAGKSKTSIVNFENGKIVLQSSNYPNDEVAAIYKKYPKTTLNTDLTRRLPKGKILGLINTTYNPQMGMELMQKSGIKEMLEEFKKPMPFDFNLIAAAFGSNMLLAVIKSDEAAPVDSLTKSMDGIKLILALPIASKVKFDELKATVKQLIDSMQQGENGPKMMKGMKPAIKYNDSLFVLSLSPDVAADFINNTGTEPVPEWLQSKSQYPMLMNFNMKEIIKMALGKKLSAKNGKEEEILMNMFDEMIVYGGNYENESLNTTMEFQFTNKTDNALKQLFDMISLVAGKNERVINEANEGAKVDSIKLEKVEVVKEDNVAPPPPKKVTVKPKANGQ